ncbi:MAG: DUF1844 domain-containing protein [bacterium]
MNDEQPNFKVTDRRLFNPDGSPREVPPEERPEPKPTQIAEAPAAIAEAQPASEPAAVAESTETAAPAATAAATATAPAAASAAPASMEEDYDEALPDADDPAGFVNFIMSIASNAASSLGMMEHPVTHKREVDLELAKHWIDILGMLEKRTKGNLVPQEEKILEGLLADLRMQFVSLNSSAAAKAPRGFSGRDIVGG